jgi:chemotaxis protein MotA
MAIVLGGNALGFVDIPAMLIVIGGGLCVTLVRFPLAGVVSAFSLGFGIAFGVKNLTPKQLIDEIYNLATIARKNGLIGLDGADISDDFLKKGIQLCVDGLDYDFVSDAMNKERDLVLERNEEGEKVLRALGDAAPAFGMIGTLVGLVQMLANMDDPSAIGPAMAVALLTTLYGAMIQNLLCFPLADKIASKASVDFMLLTLSIEGVLQIHKQQSPDIIVELLNAYLPASQRQSTEE